MRLLNDVAVAKSILCHSAPVWEYVSVISAKMKSKITDQTNVCSVALVYRRRLGHEVSGVFAESEYSRRGRGDLIRNKPPAGEELQNGENTRETRGSRGVDQAGSQNRERHFVSVVLRSS